MRWSIIRLIWLRELRDQMRDRRTLFMVAVLPLLLYPVLGFAVLQFALGLADKPSIIGIEYGPARANDFPEPPPPAHELLPQYFAWFALMPNAPFLEGAIPAASLSAAADPRPRCAPFLRVENNKAVLVGGKPVSLEELKKSAAAGMVPDLLVLAAADKIRFEFLDPQSAAEALEDKRIDLLISATPDFYANVSKTETQPAESQAFVVIQSRVGQDRYRLAKLRLDILLDFWKKEVKNARLAQHKLPAHFDEPFGTDEKKVDPSTSGSNPERIFGLLVRIFPFMLVMWSLAGALYPAVDLCAGEKERGTMETLLISPAGREEIVMGKFLTIWIFSGGTAMLNLISMGMTTWLASLQAAKQLPLGSLPLSSLLWCMVLLLPLSAFFSALCLAVGAYARSSKEGQYYLMPLFLIIMPLMFLTLAPGVELNPFYSLVPVTGAALLMQKLMTATSLAQVPWLYFIPVLAPIVLYSFLALRWAIVQFQREEVLFREAERLDINLWFKRLFREKEETPSTGQAFFIFALVLGLHWLSLSIGGQLPTEAHTAVRLLAFVATPPLFMALLLNTRPLLTLRLKWPKLREIGLAGMLAVLLLPPVAYACLQVLTHYPHAARLLEERQPLVHELRAVIEGRELSDAVPYFLLLALLPALSEELCFRGFILTGMLKSFRPRTAVLLVSFMFALYHMNVFLFLPAFCVGVVLGLLTLRSRSLVPAFVFHLFFKSVLIVGLHSYRRWQDEVPPLVATLWVPCISAGLVAALLLLWNLYRAPYRAEL